MMYHYVSDRGSGPSYVSPENFRRHMEYLKKHRYHVISMDQLVEDIKISKKPFRRESVVIAFDDGYEDNYTAAFSILKQFGFPATFFISPELIGTEGFMSWKQVKEMQEAGYVFGSHGMTQSYLPDLSRDKLRYEIAESKKVLERQLNCKVDYIAYPVGGFTEEVKSLVRELGYKAGFTTNRGNDRFDRDTYEMNRIRFSNADNHDIILMMKLSGYYNRFRTFKKPN